MSDGHAAWRRPDSGQEPAPWESASVRTEPRTPREPATYPPIPSRSPGAGHQDARAGRGGPRLAVVALVASLIGGLLASAATVVALDRREQDPAEAAQEVEEQVREQPDQAPEVTVVEGRTAVEAVAEAVLPTVVQIDIDGGGPLGTAAGNGSGVIYRSDGYIITNNHVVASAEQMEVVFADGSRDEASLVGRDVLSDIAVVRVDRDDLTAIRIGETSELRVGQLAVAIGSPFGLEGSVTAGVISALNRPISVGEGIRLPNVIQTDAPINPGNSGGALVGADGRLIGINSAILTSGSPANAGVGFAIPVSTAVDIADELIESGSVTYPYLGVEGSNVPTAAAERLGVEQGALITGVEPGTPAAQAGLRPDDVVVRLGTTEITTMDDLIIAVRQGEVGDTLDVVYIRRGEERTAEVTLVERPDL
ncbi:MAG TPA: trypsin-like peptidase domain-containing protein [Mycobacteriales bacterium]|nr:trypsin-like peptidase domain-containing protein [Egibacteraceae bacterium]HWH30551.1 trypsin-like peptidase domain-containing protein [Mycobacteriales bacterium]